MRLPFLDDHAGPRRQAKLANFRARYFADVPVDLTAIAEFRREAFPDSGPPCWLDAPDALLAVDRRVAAGTLDAADAEICRQWIVDGYYVAPGLIDHDTLDRTWAAYENAIRAGTVTPPPDGQGEADPNPGRALDPHMVVPEIHALQHHSALLRLADLFFGRRTVPFQTIMGHKGSSQAPHSDAIHMTTYPLGFLAAAWLPFEDIDPSSGPLEYYPKSHRLLPYLFSKDVGLAPVEFKKEGYRIYSERYEPAVRRYLEAYGVERKIFTPKKGDVLFWHANLVHGGAPREDLKRSRKALVCHYFAEGAVTYHDLSGNLSRLHRDGPLAPIRID